MGNVSGPTIDLDSAATISGDTTGVDGDCDIVASPPYTDVPRRHRRADAIAWASETGLMNGFKDATFRAQRRVRRASGVRVLWRAFAP